MTVEQIFDKARFITTTDSNDVTDAQLFRLLNDDIIDKAEFVSSMKQDFLLKPATAINLVASQSDYTLATDILKIKKVVVSYDGTNSYIAYPRDLNLDLDLNSQDESTNEPFYTFIDQTDSTEVKIRLYPTPTSNVTGGLNYWYVARPTALTLTTETPVTPPELHDSHVQSLVKIIAQKKGDSGLFSRADALETRAVLEFKSRYATRGDDTRPTFIPQTFSE